MLWNNERFHGTFQPLAMEDSSAVSFPLPSKLCMEFVGADTSHIISELEQLW